MSMRSVLQPALRLFSSIGLSCFLLIHLALLTWLGTLEQVHSGLFEVQKKYFESFFLVHQAGPVPVPLLGANLVMSLLFVNLLIGGVVRLRRSRSKAGVLVTHLGIGFLLVSGFVKMYFSNDGHVSLFETAPANYYQSYYRWEIALVEELPGGRVKEYLIPQEDFLDAVGPQPVTLTSPELPFDVEVRLFMPNCRPMPKGPAFDVAVPVVDGVYLQSEPLRTQAEMNTAGIYVSVVESGNGARQEGVLWGRDAHPLTVEAGGREWVVDLRKERYPMPFTIVLDEFAKEEHPRTAMPSSFSSDVTVVEGASARPIQISMNEPLRHQGLVLYQASWGPSDARPGDPLFSTLSVVRNPADQYPLYACVVIAVGLALHFLRKLFGYIRLETSRS